MKKGKRGLPPPGCTFAVDRHGKRRVRFRKGPFSTYLAGTIGSDEFLRTYAAALDGAKLAPTAIGAERTRPGSVNALVVRYYASPAYTGLKATTQTTYRGITERFRAKWGDALVRDFRRDHIETIIGGMADRKAAANNLLRILRMLFDFAVDAEMITSSPIVRVKGFKVHSEGFHSWTEDDIGAFEARHAVGTKARLALALLLYTGQRRGDVVAMGWQHVRAGRIDVRQEKTGKVLQLKIHPALAEALAAILREHLTFLTTSAGASYTSAGFGNWFREQCDAAGLAACSAHGLRKAASRRIAEANLGSQAVMSVTGHTTSKEVDRYTRAASQIRLADNAMNSMPMRAESEQNLSNLGERLDKTSSKTLKSKEK